MRRTEGVDSVNKVTITDGIAAAPASRLATQRPFPIKPDMVPGIIRTLEVALIGLSSVVPLLFGFTPPAEYFGQHLFCVFFVALAYAGLSEWANLNGINAFMRPIGVAERVVIALATCFLILASVLFGLDVAYLIAPAWLWIFFAASVALMLTSRLATFNLLLRLSRRKIIGCNLAVLGIGAQSARLLRKISRDPPYFTALAGVFSADPDAPIQTLEGAPVLGSIETLLDHVRRGLIDDIVVAMPWSDNKPVIDAIERLKELPVNVYLGADLVGFELEFHPVLGPISQLPVYEVVQRPISGWSSALKTALDYSVSLAALLLLSPLMVAVAVAVRLDSPGPIFFMQERLGFNNERFAIYKFRSMVVNADKGDGVRQATRNDPRVTRVGRFIRATSLDELPQLFNVLNGTMSLVGPRPHAISHNEEYGRQIRGYFARHKVKPGITGWAQVNGFRGETSDIEAMRQRIEHDIYYTENWSFVFDVRILLLTAAVVLFQKTAY
jgi:Undecaprenyl-phosphate glucose phosphotransferase